MPERANVCQCVCRLVVGAVDVVELASVEVPGELLDEEAVGGHVSVLGVPMPGGLLNHQVGIPISEDPLDAHSLGEFEDMRKCFIFGYVVGRREVYLQYVLEPASLGRGEDDTDSESPASFGAIEVHELVAARVGRRRDVLSFRPVDEEVGGHL